MSVPPYILRKLRKKQRRIVRRLVFVLIVVLSLSLWLWPKYFPENYSPPQGNTNDTNDASPSQQPVAGGSFDRKRPSFDVLTPAGKALEELDGWTVTPPSEGTSFFAYVDKVDNIQLQISQQELPSSFATDAQKLIDLASSFNANRTVTTADNTTVYIGTSTNGPQSVITTKKGLLILIKSFSELDDKQWIKYVESLK